MHVCRTSSKCTQQALGPDLDITSDSTSIQYSTVQNVREVIEKYRMTEVIMSLNVRMTLNICLAYRFMNRIIG